jgi:hypothetical protein
MKDRECLSNVIWVVGFLLIMVWFLGGPYLINNLFPNLLVVRTNKEWLIALSAVSLVLLHIIITGVLALGLMEFCLRLQGTSIKNWDGHFPLGS